MVNFGGGSLSKPNLRLMEYLPGITTSIVTKVFHFRIFSLIHLGALRAWVMHTPPPKFFPPLNHQTSAAIIRESDKKYYKQ